MFICVCERGVHSDSLHAKGEKNLTAKTTNGNTKIWKKCVYRHSSRWNDKKI